MKLNGETRKRIILSAAVLLANRKDLLFLSFKRVARDCKIKTSEGTVRRYYHSLDDLRCDVANHPEADLKLRNQAHDLGII